jgi:hypothetical protein
VAGRWRSPWFVLGTGLKDKGSKGGDLPEGVPVATTGGFGHERGSLEALVKLIGLCTLRAPLQTRRHRLVHVQEERACVAGWRLMEHYISGLWI